ncbi:MAG: sortase [Candidatus Nomurabacteria bacterium]|jgi:sortase A|nr:sortase [Candidatus Nomurabacteria bacterium]
MSDRNRHERSTYSAAKRQAEADELRVAARAKTSAPERAISVPDREHQIEHVGKIKHKLADQIARQQAEAEARRKYHDAWQEYYQKYYEHYYLAQLENQKRSGDQAAKPTLSARQQAIDDIRKDLLKRIYTNAEKVKKSRHFRPILAGAITVVVVLFIQYNQFFSASVHSFVSPGDETASTLIIAGGNQTVSENPTLLVPKINVRAPILFGLDNLTEANAQTALEKGVINFPVPGADSLPGQNGNTVVLGHSSSDIFNNGQYKFIFVQLSRLGVGDLFYIDYKNTRYAYEISDKKVITPNQLGELNLGSTTPHATLITCDPPGTTLNRLLVIGRQISPNPKTAGAAKNTSTGGEQNIPGNPPTLFERLFR